MKFKASVESKLELEEFCNKHGGRPLKELLESEEHGEEGAKIMYKYMPKMARSVMGEKSFLSFFNKNKKVILEHLVKVN